MTTNNSKILPPELYREGRIDEVMWFEGLASEESLPFIRSVLKTFKASEDHAVAVRGAIWKPQGDKQKHVSQAAITKAVYNFVKATKFMALSA